MRCRFVALAALLLLLTIAIFAPGAAANPQVIPGNAVTLTPTFFQAPTAGWAVYGPDGTLVANQGGPGNWTVTDALSSNGQTIASITVTVPLGTALGTGYKVVYAGPSSNDAALFDVVASSTPPPAAPTALTATTISPSQINLTWTAPTGTVTSYNIKIGTATGGPYTPLGSTATTSYSSTGLSSGTRYYFVITAVNAGGESVPSAEISRATQCAAPTGLTATSTATQIGLTWATTKGATSYSLYRGTSAGGESGTAYQSGLTGTSYTDTAVTAGTAYYYTLKALNSGGTSAASAETSATPGVVSLSSVSVSPSTVTGGTSATGTVTLSGNAPAGGVVVTLSDNSASVTVPASVTVAAGSSSATFSVTTTSVSASATATITATYSGVSKTTTLTVNPAASTVALNLAVAATGANKVTLYWNGVSGASGYNVYRATVSGGPYTRIASNVATADPGPGMSGNYLYSDSVGLTTGTEYFYVVWSIQFGGETVQSNEASDIPQVGAIPWDTGNAVQIVSQVGTIVTNNLFSDEPAVGELTIGGPNGVIYQSFQDGSPAQSYAPPGHYSATNRTLIYADGNEVPAPIDTTDSDSGVPAVAPSESEYSALTFYPLATASLKFKQSLGHAYSITNPPSGIFREVQTQPGYSSFLSYVGLPDAMDSSMSNIDGRSYAPTKPNSSKFPGSDTGYIYIGGTAYTSIQGNNGTTVYKSEIDVGLMLFRTGDSKHPGWVPVINPGGTFDAGFVGYPLEYDDAAASVGCCNYPQVFVTGEPLMSFNAAGSGTIPDGIVVFSLHAGTGGNVFRLLANGTKVQVGDITLVRAGLKGWNKRAQIVIKRMNSIAQNIKLVNPPTSGPPAYSPSPNGPGGGFNLSGSFVRGASWGDINSDDEAIDGVFVFPYGQWDAGLTWQEGSYPPPNVSSPGNPYVGDLQQNQYFWEQNINLHT